MNKDKLEWVYVTDTGMIAELSWTFQVIDRPIYNHLMRLEDTEKGIQWLYYTANIGTDNKSFNDIFRRKYADYKSNVYNVFSWLELRYYSRIRGYITIDDTKNINTIDFKGSLLDCLLYDIDN